MKYGEVVENLSCLHPAYKNEGAKSLACVGDNIFLIPVDTDTPTCPTGNYCSFFYGATALKSKSILGIFDLFS